MAKDANADLRAMALLLQKKLDDNHLVEVSKFLQENTYQSSLIVKQVVTNNTNNRVGEIVIKGGYLKDE